MHVAGRLLLAFVIALVSLSAISLQPADDTEIRIGNLMPYTGPLAEFSAIGRLKRPISTIIGNETHLATVDVSLSRE
jgi:hypothetical protein